MSIRARRLSENSAIKAFLALGLLSMMPSVVRAGNVEGVVRFDDRKSRKPVATAAGAVVRPLAPGQLARRTTAMWGGRDNLIADRLPARRHLLERLVPERGPDRALDKEAEVGVGNPRIRLHNRCLAPYPALVGHTDVDVRAWLDDRLLTGAIRTGLILGCAVCPWRDFYPIDDVGTSFRCSRCGSANALTYARWRKPEAGPIWFYELHPTAAEFLAQHGDAPLLAAHHHPAARSTDSIEYELEFADASSSKSWAEVDFAILGRSGLILGEAKSNGKLDGTNAGARVSDVRKLLRAANTVMAGEVCFATVGAWDSAAKTAFATALEQNRTTVRITLLEHIEANKATHEALEET